MTYQPSESKSKPQEIEVTPEVLASCVALASDWLSENRAWIEAGGSGDLGQLVLDLAIHLHQHCVLPRSHLPNGYALRPIHG
mgnify:CR=1 FL=1